MDCMMDWQMNPLMYGWKGVFPGIALLGFCTGILIGIFTMNLADGRTDGTDNRHTTLQTVFLVTSQVGWQTDESCD